MAIYYQGQKVGLGTVKQITSYVEVPSGSTIQDVDLTDSINISKRQYDQLNEAVNYRTGTNEEYSSVAQQIAALKATYMMKNAPDMLKYSFNTTWTRPTGWPDLDSLNLTYSGNTDFIYMTYDTNSGRCAIALHIEAVSGGTPISVSLGHISNGAFISDETINNSSNNYVKWFENPTSYSNGYPVLRILGDISLCYTYAITDNDGRTQPVRQQPILERVAYVPHLIRFTNNTAYAWGVCSLQREKIANGNGNALTSIYYGWAYCRNLQDLDISGFNVTSKVTTSHSTFLQCFKLKSLDLSNWDVSGITTMQAMFDSCESLTNLNLTGWNTVANKSLYATFSNCRSLKTIPGINNFNTNLVTSFYSLFSNCRSLQALDLTSWRTPSVTTLASVFYCCYCIEELDLSNWNVSNVTSCASAFAYCRSLKKLNLTGWNLTKLTSIGSIFRDCISLQKIDISGFHIDNKCTNIYNAFGYCVSLKSLTFPAWDVSGVNNASNTANSLFSNCWSLETLTGISNWQFTSLNNSLANMFDNCRSLKTLDVSGWNVSTATNLSNMFNSCYSLEQLNLSSWSVSSKCTTLASMFNGCYSLKTIGNISSWDTSNVTTMASMFIYCWALQTCPDIDGWSFAKVTNLSSMFQECLSFKEIDIQNLTLTKCTTMASMFRYCYGIEKINLGGWTFPAMTTAPSTFLGDCWSLREIEDISIPPLDISFANSDNLSMQALDKILERLPELPQGTTRKIILTATHRNRYTAAERTAIENVKHWNIAAS